MAVKKRIIQGLFILALAYFLFNIFDTAFKAASGDVKAILAFAVSVGIYAIVGDKVEKVLG